MANLILTNYNRMLRYLASEGNDNLTDNSFNKRDIEIWIGAVSRQIEEELKRKLHIESRTEYFDITYNRDEYWVKAPPVSTITSVKVDYSGLFDGSESDLSDYYIGAQEASVVLAYPESYVAKKALQIIYTGGLAYHGTQSVYTVSTIVDWTVGKYCIGNTSGAVGLVSAVGATTLTIEILYGTFLLDETLTEYDDEAGTTIGDATATLDAKAQTALCESHPNITAACEIQIRYLWKHKFDFENAGTNSDGTTLRRQQNKFSDPYKNRIQQEALGYLYYDQIPII